MAEADRRMVVAAEANWRRHDQQLLLGCGRMAAHSPRVAAALQSVWMAISDTRRLRPRAQTPQEQVQAELAAERAGHEALLAVVTAARIVLQEAVASRLQGWAQAPADAAAEEA